MKKYLALVIFAFIASVSFGQSDYQDVIYLKNGSVIRGVIIEQIPNETVKIETADRNVFVFGMDEVEKFTKEPHVRARGTHPVAGYQGVLEAGYQFGTGDFGYDRFKVNLVNGYRISPHVAVGVGVGLRYDFDSEMALMPFFADIRGYLFDDPSTPYMSLGVGYTFNASNDFDQVGFLIEPALGYSVVISDKSSLHIGIGYEVQTFDFLYFDIRNPTSYSITSEIAGAVSLHLGISF